MSGIGANTEEALLPSAEPNDVRVEAKADIERPSSTDTESEPEKLKAIFDDGESDSDYNVLSPPFRPRPSPDLTATQSMTCQRILQSSGYDTSKMQSIQAPANPTEAASGSMPKMRQKNRRRSSVEEKKIDLAKQAMEEVYEAGWTSSALGLCETWYNRCIQAAKEHHDAAIVARRKHVRVALPSIVVGACATGLAFFSVGDECDESDAGRTEATAISVSLAVLTSALSVLGGLTALFSLSERIQAHMVAASNYHNLARKIQLTLFIPVNLRNSCEACLIEVSAEYNSIYDQAPLLHDGW